MRTVKLVLIGSSGVGKTALRGKYITGRFFGGYRATIGADFITKTFPHPTNPEDSVTLQIWDTAGQERFSSLSNAFFRGADAALLMFDVNQPDTLESLTKWWDEFCARAPVDEEDMENFCCVVVVGNKIDVEDGPNTRVTESAALQFLERLVPTASRPPLTSEEDIPFIIEQPPDEPIIPQLIYPNGNAQQSMESYTSHFNTISSSKSGISTYFTPSSSLFDTFESALSSPRTSSISLHDERRDRRRRRRGSDETASSRSTETVTPSLFACENLGGTVRTTITVPDDDFDRLTSSRSGSWTQTSPPYRGPKLFFTSAKTGEGVNDVFEYIAHRVVFMSEYEERAEARRLKMRDGNAADAIHLQLFNHGKGSGFL
ncbi:ras-domain-containing protein [Amanita rubescens]|nr:ras-domain-containing protein [Amanita rubescens]